MIEIYDAFMIIYDDRSLRIVSLCGFKFFFSVLSM